MTTINSTRIGESGRLVVFLHGLFGRGKNFTRIAKDIEPDFSSLLVDLPNHGESEWTETFDYVELADAVAAHIAEAVAPDDQPVHLVGHSLGERSRWCSPCVTRISSTGSSSSTSAPTPAGPPESSTTCSPASPPSISIGSNRAPRLMRNWDPIPEAAIRGFLLQNLRPTSAGYSWQPNLALLHSSLDVIGDFPDMGETVFDHRVLWVAGERSDYVDRDDLPQMRSLFPRTTLLTVKGSGHWVHSEKPRSSSQR